MRVAFKTPADLVTGCISEQTMILTHDKLLNNYV